MENVVFGTQEDLDLMLSVWQPAIVLTNRATIISLLIWMETKLDSIAVSVFVEILVEFDKYWEWETNPNNNLMMMRLQSLTRGWIRILFSKAPT